MIVVSIDVGLKNLAIIRIDFQQSGNFEILDWVVISIETRPEPERCVAVNKNGSICNAKCKWVSCNIDDGKPSYSCRRHRQGPCVKNQMHLQSLNGRLLDALDMLPQLLQSELVLIENQPSMVNPAIKTVQIMLLSYFMSSGVRSPASPIKFVQCVHASLKMKACKDTIIPPQRTAYKRNKMLSIKTCEDILEKATGCLKWLQFYQQHRKKDDLADAFLQAWVYWNSL